MLVTHFRRHVEPEITWAGKALILRQDQEKYNDSTCIVLTCHKCSLEDHWQVGERKECRDMRLETLLVSFETIELVYSIYGGERGVHTL